MEENDYMSDNLLSNCRDIRPGLIRSQSTKRKYELERKQLESNKKSYVKPLKKLEEERRLEGLNSALTSSNKGFALLQKMGYKPGMVIGKEGRNASGTQLQEPIKVNIKSDRGGLGRETEIKEQMEKQNELFLRRKTIREEEVVALQQNYQQFIRNKLTSKFIQKDLWKSQKICEQLNKENDIQEPSEVWFWTPQKKDNEEENENDEDVDDYDEEDDILEPADKLLILTSYLRNTYCYCIWCGTKFNDQSDMKQNCPGNKRQVI